MKAVAWHGKEDVRVDTVDDPKIHDAGMEPCRRGVARRKGSGAAAGCARGWSDPGTAAGLQDVQMSGMSRRILMV